MVEKPSDQNFNDITTRSRSSLMPRRRRDDRKQSVEQASKRSTNYNRKTSNNPSNINKLCGSINQGKVKNFNEFNDADSYPSAFQVAAKNKYEPSERSDKFSSMYASNHATSNPLTQLRACCKKFTTKTISNLTNLSPTLATIKVLHAILNVVKILGEKIKQPEDWTQIVKICRSKEKKILSCIFSIPQNLDILDQERSHIMKYKTQ